MGFVRSPETEQSSEELETDLTAEELPRDVLDLAYLRDLLSLLQDMDVSVFKLGGFEITMRDGRSQFVPTVPRVVKDSAGSVSGSLEENERAPEERRDGWRNPNLWPTQAGRTLKLDGSYE